MDNGRLHYMEIFLDAVDFVESGRKGLISDNKELISRYDPTFYSVLEPQLKNPDPRVRREVILLLTTLRERKALERIREMRFSDNDLVNGACTAYLNTIGEEDDTIPKLIDTMRHTNGSDFRNAALKLKKIARDTDVPVIREIYGQVRGDMKQPVLDILLSVIDRYPELRSKRYLILSEPVYPNEEEFVRFLDKSIVYIDIRYTDNYSEETDIPLNIHNRIASAFKKIQIRLYNEKANLKYYSKGTKDMYKEAEDLLLWAIEDLQGKGVIGVDNTAQSTVCPHCGTKMVHSLTNWVCPECGYKQ